MTREIVNAVITSADFDIERCLTYWVHLDMGGCGQAFGGYFLDSDKAPMNKFCYRAIVELLKVVGVEKWSELKGKSVRADRDWGKVYRLGNFLTDKWIDLEAIATEEKLRVNSI